ncbi:MAG: response regulator, partial [Pseudomonadota bacterium]
NGARQGAQVRIRLPDPVALSAPVQGVVLLVDDDPELRAGVRAQLLELGCQVLEANGTDEALKLLGITDIGAILTDLQLGDRETGVDLARHVVQRLGETAPPVCIMTALPATDELHQRAAESSPVLTKPFDTHQLRRALGRITESTS